MILDRPNPNGDYIDGPVREEGFESFVGMHPIPVVHGMTVGELADFFKKSKKKKEEDKKENEEMKERIKNLEYILSDEARKISLDYEKEQIKLDKQNKFEL